MSYRYMRIVVFFDLPMEKSIEIKQYNKFRKFLIKEGFIMLQKSVYSKIALNMSIANSLRKKVYENVPDAGIVQLLIITERQFSKIETILGEHKTNVLDNTSRLIII